MSEEKIVNARKILAEIAIAKVSDHNSRFSLLQRFADGKVELSLENGELKIRPCDKNDIIEMSRDEYEQRQ